MTQTLDRGDADVPDNLGPGAPTPPPEEQTLELRWQPARGPWALEIGTPEDTRAVSLVVGERLTLGSGRVAGVRIRDRAVSARHCAVHATERGIVVEDLDSRNGLFVGAARVGSAVLAGEGSHFVIGQTSVAVRQAQSDAPRRGGSALPGLVGNSRAMLRVAEEVRRFARTPAAVLVQGESGTGKDLVARALHSLGRRSGPYVPLNVGAIAESLADAELFGHRRGAFTGAVAARSGAFEQAHRGTLFLDEVAELSPAIQVKLLRVVEDKCVRPLGATQSVRVDTRIVSASWESLADCVEAGRFRLDLYQRLSTLVVRLPPLRQRKSDIPALAEALLSRYRDEVGPRRLSSAALAKLVACNWPGNVRELGSVLYRAAVVADGEHIEARHVEGVMPDQRSAHAVQMAPGEALELLERHKGNISAAARAARVARSTFRAWVERERRRQSSD